MHDVFFTARPQTLNANFGAGELIIILIIGLVFFGGSRVAQLGSSLGKSIRDFKKELNRPDENAAIDVTPVAKKSELAEAATVKKAAVESES